MPGANQRVRKYGGAVSLAPALWFLLGVSSGAATAGTVVADNSLSDGSFSGAFSAKVAQAPPADVNCPAAEVRRGAATLTVGPTGERTAMTLKYQASFVRLARECAVVEGTMVVKVGVEGRIVLGPAGSPGTVGVPLRFAVVQETASAGARPITTKFVNVAVEISPTGNTPFVYVEEGLSFPVPTPATALDDYVVYVGFDPVSAEAQSKPAPKPRPKTKSKGGAQPPSAGN